MVFFLQHLADFSLAVTPFFFPMDTFNFSLGLEKLRFIRVQGGLKGIEVHMGESKVFERSTNGSLTNLAISGGDSHMTVH